MTQAWTDEEIGAIWAEVFDESDRGCVLLCASLLDRGLGHCLRLRFRALSEASDEDIDKVLTEYPAAALLSFTARARVAHLLGFMPKEISVSLRKFASLRNVYAHVDNAPKLTVQSLQRLWDSLPESPRTIAEAVERIRRLVSEEQQTGKLRLIAITVSLYIWLKLTAERASQPGHPPVKLPSPTADPL